MTNSVVCGIKCLSLLFTPIIYDILFPFFILTCEFHSTCLRGVFIFIFVRFIK